MHSTHVPYAESYKLLGEGKFKFLPSILGSKQHHYQTFTRGSSPDQRLSQ